MSAIPLTVEEERRLKIGALYHRTHGPPGPDRYRAIAEWWRLSAEESRVPEQNLLYAESQDRLADDMERRPHHYRNKPLGPSEWEWSGLAGQRSESSAA